MSYAHCQVLSGKIAPVAQYIRMTSLCVMVWGVPPSFRAHSARESCARCMMRACVCVMRIMRVCVRRMAMATLFIPRMRRELGSMAMPRIHVEKLHTV